MTPILESGTTMGGFRIAGVIGVGGMAVVYRAEQLSLGRSVALKVLASRLAQDEAFRVRFRREGQLVATLDHPNIVPVYDSGEAGGHLYLAMRLVEGPTLSEHAGGRALGAAQTIDILGPIADALDTAHAAGLVHRDVKPQNILIAEGGRPYLADFGVAKSSDSHGLTDTGRFVGSVNYASPEQIRGEPLTPASDIYALTGVLYQCLTGYVPYPLDTEASVMHAHLTQPPPTLSGDIDAVIARGMAKVPSERYAGARDLMSDAAEALSDLDQSLTAHVPPTARADTATKVADDGSRQAIEPTIVSSGPRRHRLVLACAAAGLVLTLTVGITMIAGSGGSGSAGSTPAHIASHAPATPSASLVSHRQSAAVRRRKPKRGRRTTRLAPAKRSPVTTQSTQSTASSSTATTSQTTPTSSPASQATPPAASTSTPSSMSTSGAAPNAEHAVNKHSSSSSYGPTVVSGPVE